jgi:hypothetical protein
MVCLTLYHATDAYSADEIMNCGFECGSGGFAGPAIYFSTSAQKARKKAKGKKAVVLRADVDLGDSHTVDSYDFESGNWEDWWIKLDSPWGDEKYDSLYIAGKDVYAILDGDRASCIKVYSRSGVIGRLC